MGPLSDNEKTQRKGLKAEKGLECCFLLLSMGFYFMSLFYVILDSEAQISIF